MLRKNQTPHGLFLWMAVTLVVLMAGLSGCSLPTTTTEFFAPQTDQSYLSPQQPQPAAELYQGNVLRQSFYVSHNGLTGVSLLFATNGRTNQGTITFALLDEGGDIIYEQSFPAAEVADGTPRTFRFPPLLESSQRAYSIELRADSPQGAGASLLADTAERYPGQLTLNDTPLTGDLLAEWSYKTTPGLLAFYAVRGLTQYGPTLLLVVLLWTLPGLALLTWLRRNDETLWSVQRLWATATALSGTLLVLLPQLMHLLNIRLGAWAVWALVLGGAGALLIARFRGLSFGPLERPNGATLLFVVVVVLVASSRFLALHPVSSPMWGDSLHHTLITQLLLDNGGIFEDYRPYVPLDSFTYHAGFHLLSAWFSWATLGGPPLSAADAVLLNGQWLNVLAVVMVGLLTEGMAAWRGRTGSAAWAGVLGLLFAGLFSPMPVYYLNWGRYTQLAGQVFLPPLLVWLLEGWRPERAHRRWLVPIILGLATIALTHYRIMLMVAMAVPLWLVVLLWPHRNTLRQSVQTLFGKLLITGVIVGLLILPWYWTLAEGLLVGLLRTTVTTTGQLTSYANEYNALFDMSMFLPRWLQVASVVALLWLTLRRKVSGLLLGGWVVGLFVLSNPYAIFRLPGTGLVNNFMIQISLYIPVAALAAIGLTDFAGWIGQRVRLPAPVVTALAIVTLLVVGVPAAWQQVDEAEVLESTYNTRLDERAASWIQQNTPPDAVFHINGFPAYANAVISGADGGWWLWLSARRTTTVPPIIYGHESGFDPDYRVKTNQRFLRLSEAEADTATLASAMRAEAVDYIYIGAQQGRMGMLDGEVPLNPAVIAASPDFQTVYSDGFVWIFRVIDRG